MIKIDSVEDLDVFKRSHQLIARGSSGELKYHLLLAKDLGYISENDYLRYRVESDEISKMLKGLAKSLSSPNQH